MEDMLSLSAHSMHTGVAGLSHPIPDHVRRAPSAAGVVPAVLDGHARPPASSIIQRQGHL